MTDDRPYDGEEVLLPARYYARAAEVLIQQKLDLASALQLAGLDLAALSAPDAQLSLDEIERLLAAVVLVTGRSDLPLDLGRSIDLRNHSAVGFAILSSPSVGYALALTARFFRLIFPAFRMRYKRGIQTAEVEFWPTLPMSHAALVFHLETVAVAAHCDIEELLGGALPAYDLMLSIERPAHHHRYRELGNARCHFDAMTRPGLRMIFPVGLMDRRPKLASAAALQMAEHRCRQLVDDVRARRDVGGWVKMMLREAHEGMPTLAELAHTLSISPRTLDRYLKAEGLSFRQLQSQQRHARACELLRQTVQPVTRIAYDLGYSDAANFTRAFRRMQGCSPTAYRAAAQRP